MNKFLKYLSFFAIVALAFVATDAFASTATQTTNTLGQDGDVFGTVLSRMVKTFQNVRSVIFVVGGFVEDRRDLFVAFLLCNGCEVAVLVARLAFARKGSH